MLMFADVASLPAGRKHLIVGTAAVCLDNESGEVTIAESFKGAAVIANMSVDQRYRKQGIARLLLRACEQHAQAMGWAQISLKVHRENAAARALYQSSGFNVLASSKSAGLSGFLSFGSGLQHIVMSRNIRSSSSL
jgi:ribosomal protein S18 acetylase RimI-like enzyme